MPKHLIKRITPDHDTIRNHKHLRVFGTLLHDANLWHLNRRSAAGAFAVGLFVAFVPVPFQMLLAAGAAIICRVNLPLSVALVWITNPLTIPPIFFFAYLVGTTVLGSPQDTQTFEFSVEWLQNGLDGVWLPFLLGCFICGTFFSLLSYFAIRVLWRRHVINQWRRRSHRHS